MFFCCFDIILVFSCLLTLTRQGDSIHSNSCEGERSSFVLRELAVGASQCAVDLPPTPELPALSHAVVPR